MGPQESNSPQGPTDVLPLVLTVEEAAALLRVGRSTAYEAVRRGQIAGAIRIGRTIRIPRSALAELLGEAVCGQPAERREARDQLD